MHLFVAKNLFPPPCTSFQAVTLSFMIIVLDEFVSDLSLLEVLILVVQIHVAIFI